VVAIATAISVEKLESCRLKKLIKFMPITHTWFAYQKIAFHHLLLVSLTRCIARSEVSVNCS
jgi:hypothetical protein